MKRIIAIITLSVMVLSLTSGCSKKEDSSYDLDSYKNMTGADGSGIDTSGGGDAVDKEFGENEYNVITPNTPTDGNTDKETESETESSGSEQTGQKITATTGDDDSPLAAPTQEEINKDNLITADTVTDFETDERPRLESATEYDDTASNKVLTYHNWVDAEIGDALITEADYSLEKLNFPRIFIDTLDGADVTSRTDYVSATITIENAEAKYCIKNRQVEIRGRGNSTWMYFDKKPYKLKFNTKIDLFGFGGNKKYVLLANALDETNMRSYLAFYLAHQFDVEYASDYQFVNVVLNGDYKGMYLLCEQVSEGQSRVDIGTSKSGKVDTGYLVESINSSENDDYKTFKLPEVNGRHLGNTNSHMFIVKSPGPDITDAQYNYIVDYVSQVNEAIFKKDWNRIKKLCDVDSFVNMTLVNAIMMNNDYGYSFYMYKKEGGKLSLGPVWDFDQSSGSSTHGGTTYRGWYAGTEHDWQTALLEIPEFFELVKKRYKEKIKVVEGIPGFIEKTINENEFDFAMNNLERNNMFALADRWRIPSSIAKLSTYKQHVSALKTWFMNRKIWLDDQLGVS